MLGRHTVEIFLQNIFWSFADACQHLSVFSSATGVLLMKNHRVQRNIRRGHDTCSRSVRQSVDISRERNAEQDSHAAELHLKVTIMASEGKIRYFI